MTNTREMPVHYERAILVRVSGESIVYRSLYATKDATLPATPEALTSALALPANCLVMLRIQPVVEAKGPNSERIESVESVKSFLTSFLDRKKC